MKRGEIWWASLADPGGFRAGFPSARPGGPEGRLQREPDRHDRRRCHHGQPASGRGARKCSPTQEKHWPDQRFSGERFANHHH